MAIRNGIIHPYNFLILHMKNYIYQTKRLEKSLCIDDFFYKFKFDIKVEKHIYFNNKKTNKNKINFPQIQNAFSSCMDLFS